MNNIITIPDKFFFSDIMINTSSSNRDQFSLRYGTCLSINAQQQLVESYYRLARTNALTVQQCAVRCHRDEPPSLAIGGLPRHQIDKTRVSSLFYSQSHFALYITSSWQQPSVNLISAVKCKLQTAPVDMLKPE